MAVPVSPPLAPAPVTLRLLGAFGVCVAGRAVAETALPRRARELLQLLSLQPQRSLPNEAVVDALWPQLDPQAGSANLRKAAHHARQFVGQADALVLRGGRIFLLPGRSVECDALCFEQAADAALAAGDALACRTAAALYAGDLLPEARYEAWSEAPRQRLRDKYLRLLRQAGALEQLVEAEPDDEAAHLALMRAELAAGRRSAALRWYGHLRDQLQQSLGVQPGAQAQALYRECVAGMQGHAPAFVGRALELVRVLSLLRGAAGGGPGAALLRAPAGMGKTAFCRRLAHEARELGWQVRAVQAGDWTRPYGLAADLVEPLLQEGGSTARQAIGTHAQSVLATMTAAAGPADPLPLPLGRHQVVGALRRLLLATASGKPVVLLVDDAHAADDASAEVLAQLAASGPPVFVLFACRPPLPELLAAHAARMLRAGTMAVVELPPLAGDEAALLASRAAGGALSPGQAAAIARLSEGLPFAVVELAQAGDGAPEGAATRLPRDAAAAIAQRLADAQAGTAEALGRLALAADDLGVEAAMALAADAGADASARLDQALAAGVLVVQDGRYRFRHALLRQALVEAVPPHRRRALHREVAARLAAANAAPGLVGQHWLAAGEVDSALPCVLAAAREAFRLGAWQDVLRHVEALLPHRSLPEMLALRAEALDALGRPGALAAYDAAAQAASGEQAQELRAKRALAQVKTSDPAGALESLRDVVPTTAAGRLAVALAYSGAATLGFGDPAEGTRRAREVRRLALETGDEGMLVIASWAQGAAAHARGDLQGSVWADLRETSHLPHLAVRVFDGHLCMTQRFLYGSRPYADVIAFADALAAEAQRLGADRGHAFAVTLRGEARLLSGQLDAAEQDLAAGERLHRAIGGATGEALSLQRRSELALYRGQRERAHDLLDEALDVARNSDVGFHLLDRIYGTRIAIARDTDAALGVLEEADAAVRGPLETCPGCRITFAIPATIASARAHATELADGHLRASEYLANVVMKLPAWHAALHEARAHVALAHGDSALARAGFARAAQGFRGAGQPLDADRCSATAVGELR